MKIIATMNRKGGVGKSTMNQHMAAILAAMGYKIGIVDTDSQGHAALMLGMMTDDPALDNGLHRVLIEGVTLEQAVMRVPDEHFRLPQMGAPESGELYLLPSSDRTYRIPFELAQGKMFALLDMIEAMGVLYGLDAVFIDTNPTLNLFDAWVFMAADAYVYVTECEQLSFDGIKAATQQIASISQDRKRFLQRDTALLGIIPNKFRANTYIHKRNIAFLGEHFQGQVWQPVTLRTEWVEATELHMPVYQHAPNKQAARDILYIGEKLREVLGWATVATS